MILLDLLVTFHPHHLQKKEQKDVSNNVTVTHKVLSSVTKKEL